MASFGEKLRHEREMRGVSLREIADGTKISVRFLQALEEDRVDVLPGGLFPRAFVRQYAAFLGLDPETFVADYTLAHGEAPSERRAAMPVEDRRPLVTPGQALLGVAALVLVVLALRRSGGTPTGGRGPRRPRRPWRRRPPCFRPTACTPRRPRCRPRRRRATAWCSRSPRSRSAGSRCGPTARPVINRVLSAGRDARRSRRAGEIVLSVGNAGGLRRAGERPPGVCRSARAARSARTSSSPAQNLPSLVDQDRARPRRPGAAASGSWRTRGSRTRSSISSGAGGVPARPAADGGAGRAAPQAGRPARAAGRTCSATRTEAVRRAAQASLAAIPGRRSSLPVLKDRETPPDVLALGGRPAARARAARGGAAEHRAAGRGDRGARAHAVRGAGRARRHQPDAPAAPHAAARGAREQRRASTTTSAAGCASCARRSASAQARGAPPPPAAPPPAAGARAAARRAPRPGRGGPPRSPSPRLTQMRRTRPSRATSRPRSGSRREKVSAVQRIYRLNAAREGHRWRSRARARSARS